MKDLERIYAEKDYRTYVGSDTRAEVQNVAVLFRSINLKADSDSSNNREISSAISGSSLSRQRKSFSSASHA